MATIQDIAAGSQYVGNAALGGGFTPAIDIDIDKAMSSLALFTYQKNKADYDRELLEKDKAVEQLAAITSLDPTNSIEPQYNYLKDKAFRLLDNAKKDPTLFSYNKNPNGFIDSLKERTELAAEIAQAKKNEIVKNTEQARIDKIQDPAQKEIEQEEFNYKIKNHFTDVKKGIMTPLTFGTAITPENYEIPTATVKKSQFMVKDINGIVEAEIDVVNMDDLKSATLQEVASFKTKKRIDVNSKEFLALDPEKQKLELKKENFKYSNFAAQQKNAENFSSLYASALKKSNETGQDVMEILKNNNGTAGVYEIVKAFKSRNAEIREYNDMLRKNYQKTYGSTAPKEIPEFNIEDGIEPHELAMLKSLEGKNIFQASKVDYKQTDDGFQQQAADINKRNARVNEKQQNLAELKNKQDQEQLEKVNRGLIVNAKGADGKENDKIIENAALQYQDFYSRVFGSYISKGKKDNAFTIPVEQIGKEDATKLGIDIEKVKSISVDVKTGNVTVYSSTSSEKPKIITAQRILSQTIDDLKVIGDKTDAQAAANWSIANEAGFRNKFGSTDAKDIIPAIFAKKQAEFGGAILPSSNEQQNFISPKGKEVTAPNGVTFKRM